MKKIIMLLIAASLFFTPLTDIVAYADEDNTGQGDRNLVLFLFIAQNNG
ncbi:MAG: hypothetical protein GX947_03575 [Tissierellia bacterium]|nr:hypothetical protein [Tissierellia bacterium]